MTATQARLPTEPQAGAEPYDVVGVGIGPFNLALAALADPVPGLRALFLDAKPAFSWHPGLMFDDAQLQVPFLADLVTMVDPTSRWSFLSYLRAHERLFPFYFSERFHVPRREYDHYCRWVSEHLPSCRFGARVTAVCADGPDHYAVTYADAAGPHTVRARNVVLGVGTEPVVPAPFAPLLGDRVLHVADYLHRRDDLAGLPDVTVVGSGQSGAEVVLDLLRRQPGHGTHLRWLTRTPAFAPMEYSKLGLEHFTPAYTDYFHGLDEGVRERLVPAQWQLYKGISADTIAAIHDLLYERSVGGRWPDVELSPSTEVTSVAPTGAERRAGRLELRCHQREQDRAYAVRTDAVVLATGYAPNRPAALDPLADSIDWDDKGRYRVDARYRVRFTEAGRGGLYVQNAEAHTHGVGAPDLGLGAYRAAVILNDLAGPVYPLPARTAFTRFGVPTAGTDNQPAHQPTKESRVASTAT